MCGLNSLMAFLIIFLEARSPSFSFAPTLLQ